MEHMAKTNKTLAEIRGDTGQLDNMTPTTAWAVRGIGPYGQDVICATYVAPGAPAALQLAIDVNPVVQVGVRAWVVTRL